MSTSLLPLSCHNLKRDNAAHHLNSMERQSIGIKAVAGNVPILHIAKRYEVSRKFVYQQKEITLNGIAQAFDNQVIADDDVLFYLPVTKAWLKQLVLALVLICRSSYQGVIEVFRDLFDHQISKGNVHNIVHSAVTRASQINREQDLSLVRIGAHDEIYQNGDPVLVGCDAHSTFCYLLSKEESCDANSWGVHLLDLKEKQNLIPVHTVADGGQALRKGQSEAWPDVPCYGDVFHALKPFSEFLTYLENRVIEVLKEIEDLEHKTANPRGKWKTDSKRQELLNKLASAREQSQKQILLVDDLRVLFRWLQKNILGLVGPVHEDRLELFAFVIEELRAREEMYPNRITPVRNYLDNHKDNLLEFVSRMQKRFSEIAEEFGVLLSDVQAVYLLRGMPSQKRWETHAAVRRSLKSKFHLIEMALEDVLRDTVRASSVVENLNSRLRNYFSLRKCLGWNYLEILRFFLNHRRFMRSERAERVGKSPAELLTGTKHSHWLEMLGFDLFKQTA